jgi:L,D-peptidoglycan transpeptidase YkuD (ErfK/YbiS/YcfS/YnhG family)
MKAGKKRRSLRGIAVRARPWDRTKGILFAGHWQLPVALGRSGIKANKWEGDGATPRGLFRPVRLWWRSDRLRRPATRLPIRPIRPDDGWCEDPDDRHYNRPIRLAEGKPGDRLRRDDQLYDLIIELDHNTRPRVARRGSAVFIHVARPGFEPTAGCVALRAPVLLRLLEQIGPKTEIAIGI